MAVDVGMDELERAGREAAADQATAGWVLGVVLLDQRPRPLEQEIVQRPSVHRVHDQERGVEEQLAISVMCACRVIAQQGIGESG
jgi:hypothetical protein